MNTSIGHLGRVVLLFLCTLSTCVSALSQTEKDVMVDLANEWKLWSTSADFCSLRYINCTLFGGSVQVINIAGMSVSGTIPPSIGNLTNLYYLTLENNRLTGTIPDVFSNPNKLLRFINLSGNQLTGPIPLSLENSTTLDLSLNYLTGQIPFRHFNQFLFLDLGSNQLTGTIPSDGIFKGLANTLGFSSNKLTGTIPPQMLDSDSTISRLDLSNNQLSGTLPVIKASISAVNVASNQLSGNVSIQVLAVKALDISFNDFENFQSVDFYFWSINYFYAKGNKFAFDLAAVNFWTYFVYCLEVDLSSNLFDTTIPDLPNFPKITKLNLSNNRFRGTIPYTMSQLTLVQELDLSFNQLSGDIPVSLNKMTNMKVFNLESNQIQGTFPSALTQVTALEELNLSNNYLTGTLPASMVEMKRLQRLKLSSNKISGTLPASLFECPLVELVLNNNQLSGELVISPNSSQSLKQLSLQDNQFSGLFPTQDFNRFSGLYQLDLAGNRFVGSFAPDMDLQTCSVSGNQFCCAANSSNACASNSPCTLPALSVNGNYTHDRSASTYQAIDVQTDGIFTFDFDASFSVNCLTLDGLIAVNMPKNNQLEGGSNTIELFNYGVLYSIPATDLFSIVDNEKCVDYEVHQWIITEPNNNNFGSISVVLSKNIIAGCVDLSETESLIIGLVVGLGSLLIAAGIIILILWKKGKLRRNIRPISKTMMNVLSAEKSFLTSVSSLKVEKELGSGSFGKVYIGKWHQTKVAMKFCNVPGKMDEFLQEASLMMNLTPHPNVLQLLAISIDGPEPVIILEYCDEGALDILLFDTNERVPHEKQIAFATGVARGMLHLHQHNLIHRDLAARNILLKQGEPKVSDFGMSRLLQVDASAGKTYGNIGPVRWMAPESLKNGIYSIKSDVWSFGVVLTEIMARSEPHVDQNPLDIGQLIRDKGLTPKIPNDSHPLLLDIMRKCFQMNPDDRPNFEDICEQLNAYCSANNINV